MVNVESRFMNGKEIDKQTDENPMQNFSDYIIFV